VCSSDLMPDTADAYIHRIGRTGRAERTGDAFTLVTPDDSDMIRTLEKIMGKPLPRQTLPDFDYTAPAPPKPATVVYPTHHSPTPHRPQALHHGPQGQGQGQRQRQKPR
jgi:ATP-dependent RNA helicase RhlE